MIRTYSDAVGYDFRICVGSQDCYAAIKLVCIHNKESYVDDGIYSGRFDEDLNDAAVGLEAGTDAANSHNAKEDE